MNSVALDAFVTVPSEYNKVTLLWIQYENSHTARLSVESKFPGMKNDGLKEVMSREATYGTILKYKAFANRAQKLRIRKSTGCTQTLSIFATYLL